MTKVFSVGSVLVRRHLFVLMFMVVFNLQLAANAAPYESSTMKSSTTYLHLLAHTPFFTKLNNQQLRWVIDHSEEWEAAPETVVADAAMGQPLSDDIWILLDGGWKVEVAGSAYPAGHADAGKWYSAADAGRYTRLITTENSYVMRITREEMNSMLSEGFDFVEHLKQGKVWFQEISHD